MYKVGDKIGSENFKSDGVVLQVEETPTNQGTGKPETFYEYKVDFGKDGIHWIDEFQVVEE